MAAIAALVAMFKTGDHLVCSRDVYAGTVRLFEQIVSGYGIEVEYVDTSDLKAVEAAMKPNTKLVHIETPSNPLMVLPDIAGVAKTADAERPPGQWNRVEILAQGPHYSVSINGKLINSAEGVEVVAGPIGLQSEGGVIQFRRATLSILDP